MAGYEAPLSGMVKAPADTEAMISFQALHLIGAA
jgi:hypothetical protein